MDAESVGFGLAVAGAVLALGAVISLLFIPTTTVPTVDAEILALLGVIVLIAGIIVHYAD